MENWKTITKRDGKEIWTRVLRSDQGFLILGVQKNAFNYEVGLWLDSKLIHLKSVEDLVSAEESIKLLQKWAENNPERIERHLERAI